MARVSIGKAFIYALCHPETGEVRYVGKSIDVDARFKAHLRETGDTRKIRWIAALKRDGLMPQVLLLEEVDESQWKEAEARWIAYFLEQGYDLTNLTDGGEGLHNPSQETRQKISAIRKTMYNDPVYVARMAEIVRSPERRLKIAQSLMGKKKSPEHIAKLPQNQRGFKQSEMTVKKRSDTQRGKKRPGQKLPPQALEKARIANLGNKHTLGRVMPEHEKLQRSLANKGKPKSAQTRAKMSLARSKYWQQKREGVTHGITLHGLWESRSDNAAV